MRRRDVLAAAAGLLAFPLAGRAQTGVPPSLLEAARALAAQPYERNPATLPPPFADLDYDAYRGIRPIPGKASMLPLGRDYAADLLPPGLFFPDPVRIDFVTADGVADVPFSTALFSFDPRYFGTVPDDAPGAGFSGVRFRYPLNAAGVLDEVLVVQGASYFRAIGRDMAYGLSARAVALGTGGPGPEEFPAFTHLRIHDPEPDGLRLEGLIDSPSLTGHVDMRVRPGSDTEIDVSATLFPRVRISDIGVAPLTSMYLKGALRGAVSDDFRPRVHDSDVLFITNGQGERLWRPISNPARIEISAFADDGPSAFGLYQTARSFESFEDAEARYHVRPACIVRPSGDWGGGAVVLVEIPAGDEFMDNIVAFWRPDHALEAGGSYRFDYRMVWSLAPPAQEAAAAIVETRSGREHDRPGTLRYVIDFDGDPSGLAADIEASGPASEIIGTSIFPLPVPGRFRVTFLLAPGDAEAVELRLLLRRADGSPASPVWLHRWTRARDGGV
jgi:glucans biosynthesis protein